MFKKFRILFLCGFMLAFTVHSDELSEADREYEKWAKVRRSSLEKLYELDEQIDKKYSNSWGLVFESHQHELDELYRRRQSELESYLLSRKQMRAVAAKTTTMFRRQVDEILSMIDRLNSDRYLDRCCLADQSCRMQTAYQFQGEARDQGPVGSCSIFGNTGLLEAAYYREYGERIDLSEMWVARNLVNQHQTYEDPFVSLSSCKLGLKSNQQLDFISEFGICRESTYPYQTRGLADFEESVDDDRLWNEVNGKSLPKKEAFEVVQSRREKFYAVFGRDNDERVKKCASEAIELKKKFSNFKLNCLQDPKPTEIEELINLGLPMAASSFGFNRRPSELTGRTGAHLYMITGYDQKAKKFILRNSWGKSWFFRSQDIGYREAEVFADPVGGEIQNMNEICVSWGPKDHSRLCGPLKTKMSSRIESLLCAN